MTSNDSIEQKNNDNINAIIEVDEAVAVLNAIINESAPALPSTLDIHRSQVELSIPSNINGFERLEIIDETINNESQAESESVASASNQTMTRRMNKKYRIHIGTRPGFYTSDLFTYDQS